MFAQSAEDWQVASETLHFPIAGQSACDTQTAPVAAQVPFVGGH
jgi:hypothetical protein